MAKKISVSIDLKDLNNLVKLAKQAKGQIKSTASSGAKDFKKLKSAIDPAYRAQKMFSDQLKVLNAQRKNIGDDQYNKYLKMVQLNAKQAGISINQFGQIASVNTRKMKRFGAVGMQQVGYQVQDFAVQVQGGTNVMVALGQQGSQLLGIFGPYGAIAGMILAIGTGLAGAFMAAKKAGDATANSLVTYAESVKSARDKTKQLKLENYRLANSFRTVEEAQLDVTKKNLEQRLKDAETKPETGSYGTMKSTGAQIVDMIFGKGKGLNIFGFQIIDSLNDKLGVTQEEIRAIAGQLALAETFEMMTEATDAKNDKIQKQEELREKIVNSLVEEMRVIDALNGKEGEALFIAKQKVEYLQLEKDMHEAGMKLGSYEYTSTRDIMLMKQKMELTEYRRIEALKAQEVEQKKQLQRFKELQREAKRLNAIQTDSEKLGASIANSFETAMMSMVDGTMSVKDAFKSMAAAIIKDLYRIYVVKKITGMITGAFAGGDAALSGPQHGGGRANGGPVQAGRSYTVGERGPEIFTPAMSGTITPNSGGTGGGATTIVQNINVSTGVQQTVRAEIRQMMPQIADSAKGAVLDAKRRGGNYGRAMA